MDTRRRRLGDILIERGVLAPEQLHKALERQRESKQPLGTVLVELGYIRSEVMADILAEQLKIARADWEQASREPDLALLVPMELLEGGRVYPLRRQGDLLTLAMVDPLDIFTMDTVRQATGLRVQPVVATPEEIKAAYDRVFNLASIAQTVIAEIEEEKPEEQEIIPDNLSESPGVKVVQLILAQAVRDHASDIHIEPRESKVVVRFRTDGILKEEMILPKQIHRDLVTRIKVISNLDITERRRPQDGRFKIRLDKDQHDVDMRISILPTIYGEKVVIRILDKSVAVFGLNEIGFLPESLAVVDNWLKYQQGLIMVTGPTGSGKTTTQYAFLNALNTPDKNIITVEDPVEYRIDGLNQVQVNPKIGFDFASSLRAVLRQDPEVVMVGEVRDLETSEIAVRAALTGHLVLTTLHTNSACGSVTRLLDMGVEPFMVSATLLGVVAQRLMRRICPHCKEEVPVTNPAELAFLRKNNLNVKRLWVGRGCANCRQTGYKGRLPVEEVLLISRTIRAALASQPSEDQLLSIAQAEGFATIQENGLKKVLAGQTTLSELWRTAYSVDMDVDEESPSPQVEDEDEDESDNNIVVI
jgi:type IV pilus assembly protein PilB